MLVQELKQISRKPVRHNAFRIDSDPAYLSLKLRELALRAHHAVRSRDDARLGDGLPVSGPDFRLSSEDDWAELHGEIVELERAFDAQHLDSLAAYAAALRQQVENCLVWIELKLASGMTAADRLKDLADVQEIIKLLGLSPEFADDLDESVREKFRELQEATVRARTREKGLEA